MLVILICLRYIVSYPAAPFIRKAYVEDAIGLALKTGEMEILACLSIVRRCRPSPRVEKYPHLVLCIQIPK